MVRWIWIYVCKGGKRKVDGQWYKSRNEVSIIFVFNYWNFLSHMLYPYDGSCWQEELIIFEIHNFWRQHVIYPAKTLKFIFFFYNWFSRTIYVKWLHYCSWVVFYFIIFMINLKNRQPCSRRDTSSLLWACNENASEWI